APVDVARAGLVARASARPPSLLELGLEDVAAPGQQRVADALLHGGDRTVVRVVELLDHLERPPARQHAPADDVGSELLRELGVARTVQEVGGLLDDEVGAPDQLVEVVQPAPRPLDPLERLGELPDRLHGAVVDARRTTMRVVGTAGVAGSPSRARALLRP